MMLGNRAGALRLLISWHHHSLFFLWSFLSTACFQIDVEHSFVPAPPYTHHLYPEQSLLGQSPIPVIHLFGITLQGTSILLNIHGFLPYLYFECPSQLTYAPDAIKKKLDVSTQIDKRLNHQIVAHGVAVDCVRCGTSSWLLRLQFQEELKNSPTARGLSQRVLNVEVVERWVCSTEQQSISLRLNLLSSWIEIVSLSWSRCLVVEYLMSALSRSR